MFSFFFVFLTRRTRYCSKNSGGISRTQLQLHQAAVCAHRTFVTNSFVLRYGMICYDAFDRIFDRLFNYAHE